MSRSEIETTIPEEFLQLPCRNSLIEELRKPLRKAKLEDVMETIRRKSQAEKDQG